MLLMFTAQMKWDSVYSKTTGRLTTATKEWDLQKTENAKNTRLPEKNGQTLKWEFIKTLWQHVLQRFLETSFCIRTSKDHINIEADGLAKHAGEFKGCKFTPKEMLQVQINQPVNFDALKKSIF